MDKNNLLILGASSDLGEAVAHQYASHGFNIILAGRHLDEMNKSAGDLLIRYGIDAHAVYFDAIKTESHKDFYQSLKIPISGVICVIGLLGDQENDRIEFAKAELTIASNYTSLVSILNIIANDFELKQSGFIIGVSSVAGERGRQSNFLYGSAKAGFTAYLSGLRNALYSANVHVLTVIPGFIDTTMTEGMNLPRILIKQPEDVASDIYRAQEKGRDVCYSGWYWRWIMLIIRNIPETIFKRLNL